MTAHLIRVTPTEATALIVAITRHLPIGYSLGRIHVIGATNLMSTDPAGTFGIYGFDPDIQTTWRLVQVGQLVETVKWSGGQEVRRYVAPGRL